MRSEFFCIAIHIFPGNITPGLGLYIGFLFILFLGRRSFQVSKRPEKNACSGHCFENAADGAKQDSCGPEQMSLGTEILNFISTGGPTGWQKNAT